MNIRIVNGTNWFTPSTVTQTNFTCHKSHSSITDSLPLLTYCFMTLTISGEPPRDLSFALWSFVPCGFSGRYSRLWAATWEKVPSVMCAQRRLKSAQSDQSLRWAHEETLHPWLSKMLTVKILTRPRESRMCSLIWILVGRTCHWERMFSDV